LVVALRKSIARGRSNYHTITTTTSPYIKL